MACTIDTKVLQCRVDVGTECAGESVFYSNRYSYIVAPVSKSANTFHEGTSAFTGCFVLS